METTFSPAKIAAQAKVLVPLHGQDSDVHRKFSMAKAQQKQRATVQTRFKEPPFRLTFIKQWRKTRGWSQGKLADAIGVSTATISQIENGNSPYTQGHLEGIAEALGCAPADLLMRNPADPDAIWSLWEAAKPAQRKQIIGIIEGLLKSSAA